MAGINDGAKYIKSVPSALKILEIVLLLVSIGFVGYFWDNWPGRDREDGDSDFIKVLKKDTDEFTKTDYIKIFLGSTVVAGIVALLFFLIFVAGIHKKIKFLNWGKTAAVFFFLTAVLMLVASGLLANTLKYYKDHKVCDVLELFDLDSQCKQLTGGVVCGFIAGAVFLVDSIVHFKL
ncbi:uncharacterized protein LOC114516531 [Dendronephthya gigantea]|uniref:uncharacterized protein LOC114516531 n=1 Tax=Dendronephthya gigantea TaxID=151771 RepID=UPI00106983FF|nr:uncharacterized protein LOC114516531 [Dendronephthya gigantea]XP_028391853.1 uncharacterized protein LOC114516531 [Dendronephthya gigantea]